MIERVGSDNMFIHLDTYHMNIEEKGAANGILDAREHLKYIHLSESDRELPVTAPATGMRSLRLLPPFLQVQNGPESGITSLGSLKFVGGDLYLKNSKIKSCK